MLGCFICFIKIQNLSEAHTGLNFKIKIYMETKKIILVAKEILVIKDAEIIKTFKTHCGQTVCWQNFFDWLSYCI